jgi:Aerotolerance regulator N-terminal/von Willebrand factor type A domain
MFLAPAFLFGLLAIGVPLWLHRVAKANPIQHPFASLMLLEASETQRTSKRTLRYWLLLSWRILLLIALALAFAGPLLTERIAPRADANARLHALILDRSLSMQEGDRWQHALGEAESVLDGLRGGDRVMLVTAAGRKVEVAHDAVLASNAGTLRAALRNIEPGIERLDYGLVMSTANNWLGSPRPPAVLHLISDFQRSGAPLRFADLEPPSKSQLEVHDVTGASSENTYIENATLSSSDTRSLEVSLRTSARASQSRAVIVYVDGKEQMRREVEIPPTMSRESIGSDRREGEGGGTIETELGVGPAGATGATRVVFPDLSLVAGAHRIEVSLEPQDSIAQDDRFHAVVEHADPKALLIARGEDEDEAAYFAAAIGSLVAPRLTVEQRNPQSLDGNALSNYSLVVVADAGALSSSAAERLTDYVTAGGAVLATLGDRSDPEVPLFEGLKLGETRSEPAKTGEIATSHPVLREAGDWNRVRFFRHRPVTTTDADKVLISYDDGTPLLLERSVGLGRKLLLTAPVDRSWNDLAIHPLFVRFIAESARYLIGPDASATSALAGSVVMTGLTAKAGGQIFDPQARRVFGLAQSSVADRLIPDQTGFYEIRGNEGVRWLAVNVDARESDLTSLPASYMQRWQSLRLREPATPAAAVPQPSAEPRSFGVQLLWLAVVLLIAEMVLANRYLAIHREVPK